MRITSLIFGTLYSVLVCTFHSQTNLQKEIELFKNSPECAFAGITFKAVDLNNGAELAALNPKLTLTSASTTKLFSTAAALELLGPEYKPVTRLYIDGVVDEGGTLNGNVWIRGGGDPSLGSIYNEAVSQNNFLQIWTDTLKKLGIKTISGSVISDGSDFEYIGVPDGWSWEDMGNYYGSGPSGICIFDNMLIYRFKTGSILNQPVELVSTFPNMSNLEFENFITCQPVKNDNSLIYGAPFSNYRFGTGALPLNQSNFEVKGSLPDPEFQLAEVFTEYLNASEITVIGTPKCARLIENLEKNRFEKFTLIYSHFGLSVKDLIKLTNVYSINLFAEQLLMLLSYQKNGIGNMEESINILEGFWKPKMSSAGLVLRDGSGLSRTNAISSNHLVDLLTFMDSSIYSKEFYASLPVSAKNGTLAPICKDKPCAGRVVAKSGTMSRVKSYAGYINTNSGKKIAFAIVVNNFNSDGLVLRAKLEAIFNAISEL
jgi:D-alanyl-D-alanine carboxypeptidase/D-alanyl-D-alanine-endopeptidase (penicillin-binding protein 4)